MEWLTVEYYRSLLSDVANYVYTDEELKHTVNAIIKHKACIVMCVELDNDYANWKIA